MTAAFSSVPTTQLSSSNLFGKFSARFQSTAVPAKDDEQDEKYNCYSCHASDNAPNHLLLNRGQAWSSSATSS